MKTYQKLISWGSAHHPKWLVVIRVILGLLLFAKGIDFIKDIAQLQELLRFSKLENNFPFLAFAIAWSHLLGGVFIIMGLFTRAVALIQFPIVAGALWINQSATETTFAICIFFLLLLFLLEGSGPISLDRYYFKKTPGVTNQFRVESGTV